MKPKIQNKWTKKTEIASQTQRMDWVVAVGDGGRGLDETVKGKRNEWKCLISSWPGQCLHECIHVSKFSKLYIKICAFYLYVPQSKILKIIKKEK